MEKIYFYRFDPYNGFKEVAYNVEKETPKRFYLEIVDDENYWQPTYVNKEDVDSGKAIVEYRDITKLIYSKPNAKFAINAFREVVFKKQENENKRHDNKMKEIDRQLEVLYDEEKKGGWS